MQLRITKSKLPAIEVGGSHAWSLHRGMRCIIMRQYEENRALTWAEFMELKRMHWELRRLTRVFGRWYQ